MMFINLKLCVENTDAGEQDSQPVSRARLTRLRVTVSIITFRNESRATRTRDSLPSGVFPPTAPRG